MGGRGDPFTYNTIEVPTVVGLLRNILTQYPDNGQIIKELVQNAEDAGATKVALVHVPCDLQYPEADQVVQRFLQGPSLCLYNNAVFSDEDWHGIRKLSDSIKKDNPLQVGTFGLGFKSIFHLTDTVTIISGGTVLFMDPSEPEDKMCRSLPLAELSQVLPPPACQRAFAHRLTTHHQAAGHFPATLFWFPLRQSASRISDTVYTPGHVQRLLDSFKVEASVCLTFLKALEEITLGVAEQGKVMVTHTLRITSSDLETMRRERQAFKQHLQECQGAPDTALTCSYQATLQTEVAGGQTQEQNMRILHYLPGENDAEWMKWGGQESSKHIPLVGVAVPTSLPAAPEVKGQTFSFLPLPPDPSNNTCLPIQVNGAFILSQNRRHVKWRSSESSEEPDVLWNEELVVKVVAKAYTKLLTELLHNTRNNTIDSTTWYTFLPDLSQTVGRWQQVARQVWQDLLSQPIIASEVCGFLKVADVLTTNDLNTLEPGVAETVRRVLCGLSLPLAALPDHVLTSLDILGHQMFPVTPQHLRNALKTRNSLNEEWSRSDLLYYATHDKNYQDLSGLALLPLQDRSWTCFRATGAAVYLCSPGEVKGLVGLEGEVTSVQVTSTVQKILQEVATSGRTQLCIFQAKQQGPHLLQKSATHIQTSQPSGKVVQKWLQHVWGILQDLKLCSVEHIPLLPTSQPPQATCLAPFTAPLLVLKDSDQLSEKQPKTRAKKVEVLALLGVVVVPALPAYIKHLDLPGYLYSGDSHGATQALAKVASQSQLSVLCNTFNAQKTEAHRKALSSLIDTQSLQPNLRNFLRELKIFKAQDMDNSITDVCLEAVNVIAPEILGFPASYPESLLVPSVPQECSLALALGAVQLSKEQLCVRVLKSCKGEDMCKLVRYILADAQLVASSTVLQELRNTRFVPDMSGSLCRPSELYDPEDDDYDALIGETQMPDGSLRQHYPLLRSLGLRKVQEMPHQDLIHLITRQQNASLSQADRTKKSVGLLRAVNRRHDCLQVCQAVKGVPCVCGVSSRPGDYPASLAWATPSGLLRPQDLTSCRYEGVVGSAVAVVQCSDVPAVAEAWGWLNTPRVDDVIQHLKNITAAYQVQEWSRYFQLLKKTYCHLADHLAVGTVQLASLKSECCIFTEQGFTAPARVYVRPGNGDLQLQPYLQLLPLELRECEGLFLHVGCAAHQNPALLLAVLQAVRKQHQGGSSTSGEVERDLRVVVSVLDRLQHHLPELPGPLLVPVTTQDGSLELAEAGQSAYTEAASEWIDGGELDVKVVHPCVSTGLARALGVAPLQKFLSAGGEAVLEWGQREPLTTRLHNLLRQYRDGVAVLKELVQNADDAKATTVHLLYDRRHNEDSRLLVLGPGMAECQGPALWAYNDALFSEQDFANLRDVGGGSKELRPTKIGKFGLGFCSVYNVTDVPSFVSGSSYVVFDPHMTHLDHPSQSAGVRFNFTKRQNSYMLHNMQGQFRPFSGVFGCNLQECGAFNGTLFRLPLRTPAQAATSKISDTCYAHTDVVQLLKMFSGVVGQLLLFTQHVSSIKVFHLHATATNPSEMVELFSASRGQPRPVPIPVPIPGPTPSATGGAQSLLERTAALFTRQQDKFKWNGGIVEERGMAEVSVEYCGGGVKLCGLEEGEWTTTWVTSWHSGSGTSCHLAEAHGGKALPLSAVTVPVKTDESGWRPQCLADLPPGFYHEGFFHCFLPLPVKTFLPVQINGVLEVASDRTGLLTQTQDDRQALSWNATLLEDATVHAHLGLAQALRHLEVCAESEYYATWPVVGCGGGTLVDGLCRGFYHTLEQEDPVVFRCGGGDWHPLSRCLVLAEDFLKVPDVGDAAFEFLETYLHSSTQQRLIRLPVHIQAGFEGRVLSRHTVTQQIFFREYFIPHLSENIVCAEKRDLVTLHLLESGRHPDVELLRALPCIPTQPQGILKSPGHLISPKAKIAGLFTVEDERFPQEHFVDSSVKRTALSKLGMHTHSLPREVVVERAQSVAGLALACPQCATLRIMELLQYISTQEANQQQELADELIFLPFLPVMSKPESWSFAWHGGSSEGKACGHCLAHSATSDDIAYSVTLDDIAHSATSDDIAHSATLDDIAHSATSDDIAYSVTLDDIAHSATSDDIAYSATSDDIAYSATLDDIAYSATSDDIAHSATSDDIAHSATLDDIAHSATSDARHNTSLVLDCPSALCLPAFKPLVGSSHSLLQESVQKAPQDVLEKLGVIVHRLDLPLRSVVDQLCVFSAAPKSDSADMCHVIYEHLEDLITDVRRGKTVNSGIINDIGHLRDKKTLLTSHGFQEPEMFALHSESDCAPDLFCAQTEGLKKYQCLMEVLGIKENFDYDVVMKVIQKKKETYANQRLGDDEVSRVSRLLNVLFKVKKNDSPVQGLHLPDSQGCLHATQDLCFEDDAQLSSGHFLCLHPSISLSRDMREWLGIKSKTRKRLQESSNRLQFGQKEPLTTRLRNILHEYPCDSGIMKELLQNADDAGATEVTFYKDFRQLPKEKLFDSNWAPLQGPSLCVFNNKGLTQQDLQSIQDLGNSSKREDPATTGQYGIGFNAVYHLTDAPSFLTRGPQVPQGETLCMFDPHCWYDPFAEPEAPGVQMVNLNDLRQDHPHSFIGYLEEECSQEGTMFRLPLRTTDDSLISKEILREDDINKMLQEFKMEMPHCLLFLKSVRKISVKVVEGEGQCKEEYSVEAHVSTESRLPALPRKHWDAQEARHPCSVDMVRTSYRINIEDSQGSSSQWLVVQQLGVADKNSLPEIVKEAFSLKTLNLLPHGGVALLLSMNSASSDAATSSKIFSTSCYLPLPAASGLPFSINGHFALNSSRRDLWTGRGDFKGLWNAWLLKELLVPAAAYAVELFRTLLPGKDEDHMAEPTYKEKVRMFQDVLPHAQNVTSEQWRSFVRWFYEHVRSERLPFFDSFVPDTDVPRKPATYSLFPNQNNPPKKTIRKGCLKWHAFHASGDEYSVYFSMTTKEHKDSLQDIADIFRRLGMKLSSEGMYRRLVDAEPEFACPLLTPDAALGFMKSWDQDINDRCKPRVGTKVANTPFLKPDNVLIVLKYIMKAKGFSDTCVDKLPLLLTNDGMLGCFSVHEPVFVSSFCGLLPTYGKEFTSPSFVTVIENNDDKFKGVVKKFTPADLGARLPPVLQAQDPSKGKGWLKKMWSFVVDFTEECKPGQQVNWAQGKEYILRTLGDWALYPVKNKGEEYLIPIKNAWQVLNLYRHHDSVFHKLPVPFPSSVCSKDELPRRLGPSQPLSGTHDKPFIPRQLQLATTLEDPAAVLQLLDFHRESVNAFFDESGRRGQHKIEAQEILEYFGSACQKPRVVKELSRDKIRALQVFKDPSGHCCTLLNRELVVLDQSLLELDQLENICAELSLLIIPKPESPKVRSLYTYLEPNCIMGELDLYSRIILPNITFLHQKQRTFYLERLNRKLPQNPASEWSEDEQRVVASLKACHFIEVDGTLKTANLFYDPKVSVFTVMGVANLPKAWKGWEWHRLLKLAGMVHEVTPDKFMEFASSLSLSDAKVQEKSDALCEYLKYNPKNLQPRMCEILDTQFLVPEKCDRREKLLPHHQTDSGLIAFSKSAWPTFANIIWSTKSLLPSYATEVAINLQKHYSNKINTDTPPVNDILEHILVKLDKLDKPPVNDILEHIVKFCTSKPNTPEKSPLVVGKVMESIYEYLSKCQDDVYNTLKARDIPLIHIPKHNVFVSISLVVESLEEEILPYFYRAPVAYGKFFDVLRRLGMPGNATANNYAQVLSMIYDSSKQSILHPQEMKSMKMALKGLMKLPNKLKDLTVAELYLPTRNETLRKSSEMFVADNMELLLAVEQTFDEPVFAGFRALDVISNDCFLVQMLPQTLQPTFLSEACRENLQLEGMFEEGSELLDEIKELLLSETFKMGVLRIINHYKMQAGSSVTEKDRMEILTLLGKVTVKQVNRIVTTLTWDNIPACQRDKTTFLQVNGDGDQKTVTLYLSKKVSPKLIPSSLHKAHVCLLEKWDINLMGEFLIVFACHDKPHDIYKCLDEVGIKDYNTETPPFSLFKCDVGSYLPEKYLPLLDNGFSEFHEKEIVCMRKYLCSNEEEGDEGIELNDIFVIVEVVRMVEKHATCHMLNRYEVNTSKSKPCLVIAKACQLFHFVRKDRVDGIMVEAVTQNGENKEDIFKKSRKDIYREIREQLKEIWQVQDEQERRHLLRRLMFKWHPDKNPEQVALCTSVMQYIQCLVGRLESGQDILDDEETDEAPQATPSAFSSKFFRPPPSQYRNNNRRDQPRRPRHDQPGRPRHDQPGRPRHDQPGRPRHDQPRRPRHDLPEARRWHRQACSDLEAAKVLLRESPSWVVFLCYQAAEKVLLAVLYAKDRDEASTEESRSPLHRTLTGLAQSLDNPRALQLATMVQLKAGGFLGPLYPSFAGCPRDRYTQRDAEQVLLASEELLQVLGQCVQ